MNYVAAVDVWSVGCIFAEMLSNKPIFPGKHCLLYQTFAKIILSLYAMADLDQVHIILNIVGSPNQEDLESVTSEQVGSQKYKMMLHLCHQARRYLQSLPFRPTVPWNKLYSKADQQGRSSVSALWLS